MADWHEYGEMRKRERQRKLGHEPPPGPPGCFSGVVKILVVVLLLWGVVMGISRLL